MPLLGIYSRLFKQPTVWFCVGSSEVLFKLIKLAVAFQTIKDIGEGVRPARLPPHLNHLPSHCPARSIFHFDFILKMIINMTISLLNIMGCDSTLQQ